MGQGREREKPFIIGIMNHIHAVRIKGLFQVRYLMADDDGLQTATQGIGQLAAFGKQFQAHVGNAAFFGYFAIYKYVPHFFSSVFRVAPPGTETARQGTVWLIP